MSLNRKDYFRRVYSGLDFAADVGGLFSAIAPICHAFLAIFNSSGIYQFLMGDLFVSRVETSSLETSHSNIRPNNQNPKRLD
mmetsp:Transcript_16860/g.20007  ORF Transcript_16860/g.20007 Transcript_16860/m.20007 type:complete len:82 (-) Transcript_16860:334-579(-)